MHPWILCKSNANDFEIEDVFKSNRTPLVLTQSENKCELIFIF